jgi:hypothetical protein
MLNYDEDGFDATLALADEEVQSLIVPSALDRQPMSLSSSQTNEKPLSDEEGTRLDEWRQGTGDDGEQYKLFLDEGEPSQSEQEFERFWGERSGCASPQAMSDEGETRDEHQKQSHQPSTYPGTAQATSTNNRFAKTTSRATAQASSQGVNQVTVPPSITTHTGSAALTGSTGRATKRIRNDDKYALTKEKAGLGIDAKWDPSVVGPRKRKVRYTRWSCSYISRE